MAKNDSKDASHAGQGSALEQAIAMLTADHDEVRNMFREYKKLMDYDAPAAPREDLARRICNALSVHAALEEAVFYPAAREALPEDKEECLDHAEVEHASIKRLVAEIESGNPDDPLFDAKVHVLQEYVAHHVCEEENEMFAELRQDEAKMDDVLAAMQAHSRDWAAYVKGDESGERDAQGKRALASTKLSAAPAKAGTAKARQRVSRGAARKTVKAQGSSKAKAKAKS